MGQPDGLPEPRRTLAIGAILVSIVITVLDTAMINVALPAIGRDLGVDPARVIWLTNAYQVVVVATLISFASLAEILGFRRVFLAGMVLYVTASLGCGSYPLARAVRSCRHPFIRTFGDGGRAAQRCSQYVPTSQRASTARAMTKAPMSAPSARPSCCTSTLTPIVTKTMQRYHSIRL